MKKEKPQESSVIMDKCGACYGLGDKHAEDCEEPIPQPKENKMKICKECGKKTEAMYPVQDYWFCEEHSGSLCCERCFELYLPLFPERAELHGKWSGHCNAREFDCHNRQSERRKQKESTKSPPPKRNERS